jgi:hypothetical protein
MDIATLQRRMVALGYPLAIDGRYGPCTRVAVLAALRDPPDTSFNRPTSRVVVSERSSGRIFETLNKKV